LAKAQATLARFCIYADVSLIMQKRIIGKHSVVHWCSQYSEGDAECNCLP